MGNKYGPSGSDGSTGDSYGDESRKPEDETEQEPLPATDDEAGEDSEETASSSHTKRPKSVPNSAGSGGGRGGAVVPESPESADPEEEAEQDERADEQEAAAEPSPEIETEGSENEAGSSSSEQESEEDGKVDEDQGNSAEITIIEFTNAWAAESWCNEPRKLKLRERYRHQLEFELRPYDPIKFEDPRTEAGRWIAVQTGDNPVNQQVWTSNPPADTCRSTRAIEAAINQGAGFEYTRRLWIRTLVSGENVEDDELLIKQAQELDLNTKKFIDDFDGIEQDNPVAATDENTSPDYYTFADFLPVYSESDADFGDLEELIAIIGGELSPLPARAVPKLLDSYGPLTTEEIRAIHGWSRERTIQQLATLEDSGEVMQAGFTGGTLWSLPNSE